MAFFTHLYDICKKRLLAFVKTLLLLVTAISANLAAVSCGDDDYNDLPREIQSFISQYFAGQGVANFSESGGTYTVNLDNSATLVFTPSLIWQSVDGNGNTVPGQFLFDQLPSPLYDYIETTDNLGEVYAVSRDAGVYMVTFHNYVVSYSTRTGDITPVVTGPEGNG